MSARINGHARRRQAHPIHLTVKEFGVDVRAGGKNDLNLPVDSCCRELSKDDPFTGLAVAGMAGIGALPGRTTIVVFGSRRASSRATLPLPSEPYWPPTTTLTGTRPPVLRSDPFLKLCLQSGDVANVHYLRVGHHTDLGNSAFDRIPGRCVKLLDAAVSHRSFPVAPQKGPPSGRA